MMTQSWESILKLPLLLKNIFFDIFPLQNAFVFTLLSRMYHTGFTPPCKGEWCRWCRWCRLSRWSRWCNVVGVVGVVGGAGIVGGAGNVFPLSLTQCKHMRSRYTDSHSLWSSTVSFITVAIATAMSGDEDDIFLRWCTECPCSDERGENTARGGERRRRRRRRRLFSHFISAVCSWSWQTSVTDSLWVSYFLLLCSLKQQLLVQMDAIQQAWTVWHLTCAVEAESAFQRTVFMNPSMTDMLCKDGCFIKAPQEVSLSQQRLSARRQSRKSSSWHVRFICH